jgi:ABC-type nitrate/sulfonate/bicarbonate transport system permease component
MELTTEAQSGKDVVALLKLAMPLQVISNDMLEKIAAEARRVSYKAGDLVYERGERADDVYVIVRGQVEHILGPGAGATNLLRNLEAGEVFGWAALLKSQPFRLAKATALSDTECLAIGTQTLLNILESEPETGNVVMSRFATMITRDYSVPDWMVKVKPIERRGQQQHLSGAALTMFRFAQWLKSPRPYLMVIGFTLLLGFWYLAVEAWKLPRFAQMPGLTSVLKEWVSENPVYGLSLYTPEYYQHIWVSCRRVGIAFFLATMLGVPLGLFLGWSQKFKEYVFPVFEMLRPIPILAWVPLAILMFTGLETPVLFLAFLASFFATALNTMLGVQSIDESYFRAGYCLGANRWQVFRHIIVPGAMPYIFTGLQISIGVCWFSLVAAEMVSGQFGLGYVINNSYTTVRYPTIIIGMFTLGAVGYVTSALVRIAGDHMMQWRVRELALGGNS